MGQSAHGYVLPSVSHIPRLQVQVNAYNSGSKIVGLRHAEPSVDPTVDGYYDWNDPTLTLFTRDLTAQVLALNPVIVLERYLTKTRNQFKSPGTARSIKRWVIPGNTSHDGDNFHGGNSGYYRGGGTIPEVNNFIPFTNPTIVGYNHVMFDGFTLPVSRFVRDNTTPTTYGTILNRAVLASEWTDTIRYSQMPIYRNHFLKFRVSLAIPNPSWTVSNHENRWLFGEGQTIIVEPKLQTFDDGTDEKDFYVGWQTKAVN